MLESCSTPRVLKLIIYRTISNNNVLWWLKISSYFFGKFCIRHLVQDPGAWVCHLNDGAYFGEIALLSKETKRTANVIALEICETYRLDKKIFKSCLRKNPECLKIIQMVAELRHQRTNALEETFKEELFHKTYIGETTETRRSRAFSTSQRAQSIA
ncbi:hypothetical protein WA026_001945 [Henosepilachna vigintioctopunctata]|uniref:Cyclic nucleotide-binding domain-containing protein n=1 Tax=Henosepilachna vigintioctopunctata TaxID=420089 RepID=A0AAW1UUT7_9CUCU